MPSVAVKLYSVYFKLLLKHKLQTQIQKNPSSDPFGITARPDEPSSPANPSFSSADGVATKDIHIDPLTSLSVRIFLPDSSLSTPAHRRSSYNGKGGPHPHHPPRRSSFEAGGAYRGYLPDTSARSNLRKLPIIVQFHGGAFVSGSNVSSPNDFFCRRIAKTMEVIVVAVGYRLAPESRYPAAFDDGIKVLNWLGKQANLAECRKSLGGAGGGTVGGGNGGGRRRIIDAFGASSVEPWLASHGDPSR